LIDNLIYILMINYNLDYLTLELIRNLINKIKFVYDLDKITLNYECIIEYLINYFFQK
jgi:hypothetical protein